MGNPLLMGLGQGFQAAGNAVGSYEETRRRALQDAMIKAIQQSQLDSAAQTRQFNVTQEARAAEDQVRQNKDFANKNTETLLTTIPRPRMSTDQEYANAQGGPYEGFFSPVMGSRSTIGSMSLPGIGAGGDLEGGQQISSNTTTMPGGHMMEPMVPPALKAAMANNDTKMNQFWSTLGLKEAGQEDKRHSDEQLMNARMAAVNASLAGVNAVVGNAKLAAETQTNIANLRAQIDSLNQEAVHTRDANARYQGFLSLAYKTLAENGGNPYAPDWMQKVQAQAEKMMAAAPVAPAAGAPPQIGAGRQGGPGGPLRTPSNVTITPKK